MLAARVRRCLLLVMSLCGAVLFRTWSSKVILAAALLKDLSSTLDTTMKSALGPCLFLLWWLLEDGLELFLATCGALYAAYLYYQGLVPASAITGVSADGSNDIRPEAGVVWLHGLGDTAQGCKAIASVVRTPRPARWVFPSAPVRQVSVDWGLPRRAWFDVASAPVRVGSFEDRGAIVGAVKIVHEAVRSLEADGIEPSRIIVGGLSQGGALALAGALTYSKRLGGAACLSGWLPRCIPLPKEGSLCPIFWQHGAKDDAVLVELQEEGVARLKFAGAEVSSFCDEDAGHVPGIEQVMRVEAWLHQVLGP